MEVENFIDELKRDRARGNLAPHQILLLISLFQIYTETKNNEFQIIDVIKIFNKTWVTFQHKFKTNNMNIGMPLKVFVNKSYIEIDVSEDINDFRNKKELESKISNIIISHILIQIFNKKGIKDYLISRIDK